ncbi:hypothetical protein MPTK2_4g07190 [Marchantia polymorpha subsp. ruderalis]
MDVPSTMKFLQEDQCPSIITPDRSLAEQVANACTDEATESDLNST